MYSFYMCLVLLIFFLLEIVMLIFIFNDGNEFGWAKKHFFSQIKNHFNFQHKLTFAIFLLTFYRIIKNYHAKESEFNISASVH